MFLHSRCAAGPAAWFSLETQDGQKPVHFASRADGGGGGTGLNAAMMRAIAHIASGGAPPPIRTGAFAGPGAAHPSPQSTASALTLLAPHLQFALLFAPPCSTPHNPLAFRSSTMQMPPDLDALPSTGCPPRPVSALST